MTDPKELERLVRQLIPPAVIFADHEDHVADLRRRATEALQPYFARLSASEEQVRVLRGALGDARFVLTEIEEGSRSALPASRADFDACLRTIDQALSASEGVGSGNDAGPTLAEVLSAWTVDKERAVLRHSSGGRITLWQGQPMTHLAGTHRSLSALSSVPPQGGEEG